MRDVSHSELVPEYALDIVFQLRGHLRESRCRHLADSIEVLLKVGPLGDLSEAPGVRG